jgi:non-heme chloroperoxidase
VAKAVLIGAVPPLMLKTEANPGGLPIKVFDEFGPAFWPTARSSSRT